jgi:hypothetical protein
MTTSGRSPFSIFLPRRRSLLIGTASTAVLATLGTGTGAAGTRSAAAVDFDFDAGNFHRDLLSTPGNLSDEPIGPMDASVLIYLTHLTMAAWFDALAPYHRTVLGVYSRIARRPASESATNRNKNIAALHAGYRVIKNTFAEREPAYRQLMTSLGLNPDDESMNPATPVGIGNRAAQAVLRARARDGMNYLGGGPGDKSIFVIQKFATPQLALVRADTCEAPGQFELAPPDHTAHTHPRRCKSLVDEMLAASAGLTDEHKTKAKFFDNKFLGIGQSTKAAAEAHDLDLQPVRFHDAVRRKDTGGAALPRRRRPELDVQGRRRLVADGAGARSRQGHRAALRHLERVREELRHEPCVGRRAPPDDGREVPEVGRRFGDRAYELVQRYAKGEARDRP